MSIPKINETIYKTISVQVDTPDGKMFVHILEDNDGNPKEVLVNIGKTGTNLAAWADATARLVTKLIQENDLHKAISELSGITSSGLRVLTKGEIIRSGPDGIVYALLRYKDERYRRNKPKKRDGGASTDRDR